MLMKLTPGAERAERENVCVCVRGKQREKKNQ